MAEDLRSQILGQLSEGINYLKLYAEALRDPKLHRTEVELQAALENASEARIAVFELFQDLDGFSLDDYEPLSHTSKDVQVLTDFVRYGAEEEGLKFVPLGLGDFRLETPEGKIVAIFTPNRERAQDNPGMELLGLDHPKVMEMQQRFSKLPPSEIGIRVKSPDSRKGCLAVWKVETEGADRQRKTKLITIAVGNDGERISTWEHHPEKLYQASPVEHANTELGIAFYRSMLDPFLQRELGQRGILSSLSGSYRVELVALGEFH